MSLSIPPFEPHALIRGGHAQTLFAHVFQGRRYPYVAQPHQVRLIDDDVVVLHDDCPDGWTPHDGVAVLMHGLTGCHQSAYMNRTAAKLNRVGIRTFRMDLRGCGAGVGLAHRPYNAAQSGDLDDVVRYVGNVSDGSPLTLVGFSLSGNLVLKYLGEHPEGVAANVVSAVAVSPAADLVESQVALGRRFNRFYDRYFTGRLMQHCRAFAVDSAASLVLGDAQPRTLREFDERVTAPLGGFESAEHYYRDVSALQWMHRVRVPTFVLTARDDPIIPAHSFETADLSPAVRLHITISGGHLGFVSRGGNGDPDRRWMDWRVVDWVRNVHSRTASASDVA